MCPKIEKIYNSCLLLPAFSNHLPAWIEVNKDKLKIPAADSVKTGDRDAVRFESIKIRGVPLKMFLIQSSPTLQLSNFFRVLLDGRWECSQD